MIFLKTFLRGTLVLLLICSLFLTSCGGDNTSSQTESDLSSVSSTQSQGGTSSNKKPSGSQGSSSRPSQSQSGQASQGAQSGEAEGDEPSQKEPQGGVSSKPQQSANDDSSCKKHVDDNDNGACDICRAPVLVYFDFYAINDLHGKFADTSDNVGVDELTTYLKRAKEIDDNAIFLSAGDMWQGSSESNTTKGAIITDWMNELDFAAMALGNHEFDWGEEFIADNAEIAEFPFLAINVYDRKTNKMADFCKASTMVEGDGLQIGIIGAIGDCYSSIASDKCDDVYFKVGRELTALVKAESEALKKRGADFIVYVLHDGYGKTISGAPQNVSASQISSYYDTSLSDGYVDLVFEGHTHQGYRLIDQNGVYHLQHRGDNKGGISHVEVGINIITGTNNFTEIDLITTGQYQSFDDDPIVNTLLKKYDDVLSPSKQVLGFNSARRNYDQLCQLMADAYYNFGVKEWGDKYKIALGGGYLNVRSPYYLNAGNVTYADLQSLFPFDNTITLCSIKGRYLKQRFFETSNDSYYLSYGDYGKSIKNNIDLNATYYVIVDSYTANYSPNRLTVVEEFDKTTFPRDLFADFVKSGGLD